MTAREETTSPIAQKPTALKPYSKANKVAKRKENKQMDPERVSQMIEQANRTPVALLKNGLIDMSKTPAHLIAIMEKNAKDSLLLSLPGELRNQIWGYAIGGHRIAPFSPLLEIPQALDPVAASAFRFPQVCRQIYMETSILTYQLTTFILLTKTGWAVKWCSQLLPAQKDAVKCIALNLISVLWTPTYLLKDFPIKRLFSNLTRLELLNERLSKADESDHNLAVLRVRKCTNAERDMRAVQKVRSEYGEGFEIVTREE